MVEAWTSDKFNVRGHILVFNCVLEIIGIAVLGYVHEPYGRYVGAN